MPHTSMLPQRTFATPSVQPSRPSLDAERALALEARAASGAPVSQPSTLKLATSNTPDAQISFAAARNAGDVCPITQEPLDTIDQLVLGQDGYAYDRQALHAWLLTSTLSPMTRLPMPETVEALMGPRVSFEKRAVEALRGPTGRYMLQAVPHLFNGSVGVRTFSLAHPALNFADAVPLYAIAALGGIGAGIMLNHAVHVGVALATRLIERHQNQRQQDLEMQYIA